MPVKAQLKWLARPVFRLVKKVMRPGVRRFRGMLHAQIDQTLVPLATDVRSLRHELQNLPQQIPAPIVQVPAQPSQLTSLEQLILGMISQQGKRPEIVPPLGAFAIPLGEEELLLPHPLLPFYLHVGREAEQLPWMAIGRFESFVTSLLHRYLTAGDHALDVDPGHGYHTLSMALLAGPNGMIWLPPAPQSERNLSAHGFANRVRIDPRHTTRESFLRASLLQTNPALIRLNAPQHLSSDLAIIREARAPECRPVIVFGQTPEKGTTSRLLTPRDQQHGYRVYELKADGQLHSLAESDWSPHGPRIGVLSVNEEQ
jgi:hypothetical protein